MYGPRGVARIFQGGVQFAEILLITYTLKKPCLLFANSVQQLGCLYIVAHKTVAIANSKHVLNEHKNVGVLYTMCISALNFSKE